MATFREAMVHARTGGIITSGGKTIRFLTFEEAEPILLEQNPSRRTQIDPGTGKAAVTKKQIVVEQFADPRFPVSRLGLYDVSQTPPAQFRPAQEDMAAAWIRQGIDDVAPEPVAPETVDETLAEHEPAPPE